MQENLQPNTTTKTHNTKKSQGKSSKSRAAHPHWALQFRRPGTELRKIHNNYYLYEYQNVYDANKKRYKKVTGQLLGSIKEKYGFVPSPKYLLKQQSQGQEEQNHNLKQAKTDHKANIQVGSNVEYGVSKYFLEHFQALAKQVQNIFGNTWQYILMLVYCRLLEQAPIKNMPHLMEQSWLKQAWQVPGLHAKAISALLKDIGKNRDKTVAYMQAAMGKEEYFLADTTHIPTKASNISLAKKGYNSQGKYDPQVHLLYLYGASSQMPAFYRLHAGNVREMKAFKLTMLESGVKDGIIIGDKGFYSRENIDFLTKEGLSYIIPLKRNSTLLDYSSIQENSFKAGDNYFEHEKRFIWYKEIRLPSGEKVVMYLDEHLRLQEETTYLKRIQTHPETHSQANYMEKKDRFGSLSLVSNLSNKSAKELYQGYKTRLSIETMFDSLKNVLGGDKTYMHDEETLQGWMFINHLALQCYQKIYLQLKNLGLSNKYSVEDLLKLLRDVRRVKIDNSWHQSEIPATVSKLLDKLQVNNT